jgi:Cupin
VAIAELHCKLANHKQEKIMNYPQSPAARSGMSWNAENIDWQEIGLDGSKYALLEGKRTELGVAFTYAFLVPAGFWDAPHWHSADARIFVIKGKLKLGYATELRRSEALTFNAGSTVLVPRNAVILTARMKTHLLLELRLDLGQHIMSTQMLSHQPERFHS